MSFGFGSHSVAPVLVLFKNSEMYEIFRWQVKGSVNSKAYRFVGEGVQRKRDPHVQTSGLISRLFRQANSAQYRSIFLAKKKGPFFEYRADGIDLKAKKKLVFRFFV